MNFQWDSLCITNVSMRTNVRMYAQKKDWKGKTTKTSMVAELL